MCPARKKLFDEIPYLEGERVILRKITEDDRETLWEMAQLVLAKSGSLT